MDNTYIPVSSNDTLLHLALPKSPETLCGRIVVDRERHPSASDITLKCDLCDTLSGGNSFLKTNDTLEEGITHLASDHNVDVALVPSEILEDDEALELFHKQAHFHEAAITDEKGRAVDSRKPKSEKCTSCGQDSGSNKDCSACSDKQSITFADRKRRQDERAVAQRASSVEKTATNYTRNGIKIEDGFNLVLTASEASEIPYLDTNRVTISDKIHCPDCEEDIWLARVASCTDCGELKCDSCMDDSSFNFMLGTCKKCANVSQEEENYFLNSYDDTDYSLIQRASGFFAEEDYDEEATFLSPDND